MQKLAGRIAMVVLGLGALGVTTARAQGLVLGAFGGISAPVNSDFTDDFKLGWQAGIMGEYVFNNPLFGVRLDGRRTGSPRKGCPRGCPPSRGR